MRIVVAEGGGMAWLAVEGRAVCRLVCVCGLLFGGIWQELEEVRSMEETRCRCGRSS